MADARDCQIRSINFCSKTNGSEQGVANTNLSTAKTAKQDEYYTQWADIQREMNAYLEYDPDVFRGKTLLLPCDDPEWSNFTKYFALHFTDLGLKKLISTSYAPNSNAGAAFYTPTLFETEGSDYDPDKSLERGRLFTLTADDISGDGRIDIDDLHWKYLDGDGDFRSDEVSALRDEADMVITNPPFSLFRTFVAWLIDGEVKFSIIGSNNAPTTKEIFPLFQNNLLWKGATGNSSDMVFAVPEGVEVKESDRLKAERMGYKGHFTRLGNSCWFTNIEHGRRHEPLKLMTMADNTKFSRHKDIRDGGYQAYDNFDAIEIGYADAIPSDFDGTMGVPISYLDRHNPDQFEIVGITKTWFGAATKKYPQQIQISKDGKRSKVGKLNDGAVLAIEEPPSGKTHYEVDGQLYRQTFPRILIRHRNPDPKKD